jgi:hypothetical protein
MIVLAKYKNNKFGKIFFMRYLSITLIIIFSSVKTLCQEIKNAKDLGPLTIGPAGISANDMAVWQVKTIEAGALWGNYTGVKGNAFYNKEWDNGYILLRDNRIARNVTMAFNIYTNEIYFQHDGKVFVLEPSAPVAEFGINGTKEDSIKITLFRSGYPAIDNNTDKTFYEVLVNNRISLLKLYSKKIMEKINTLGVPERVFIDSELWYAYDSSQNKIIPIKKNKNAILEALPQYANKIQSIIQASSLKLKSESELIILFNKLNNDIN